MTAIKEIKNALNDKFDSKVFPIYLKAISETFETSEELKERIIGIGAIKANFSIPEANVVAHLEAKVEVSVSGGKGLYKNPDLTIVITENVAKDMILRKSSLTSLLSRGMVTRKVKTKGNLSKAMKQMPMFEEGDGALYGYKSKEKMPENVRKIKKARELGECDVELFPIWLKATEETEGEFNEKLIKRYAETLETSKFNYKIPSAGIGAHYGYFVKQSILGGEGAFDAPDITLELTKEIAKDLMTKKISLSTAYNAGYIDLERKHAGKLASLDPIFRLASEELGIKDL